MTFRRWDERSACRTFIGFVALSSEGVTDERTKQKTNEKGTNLYIYIFYLFLLNPSLAEVFHLAFGCSYRRPRIKPMKARQDQHMCDFDYDTIDEIDDADDDSLHVLIKEKTTGKYGWHWVYRDALAEQGLHDLAEHGMFEVQDAE
jgi:hypothetical protein